jgi:putative heme-binding domain-containing protein
MGAWVHGCEVSVDAQPPRILESLNPVSFALRNPTESPQSRRSRVCAACHHLGGGTDADVGPDLATVRHRPPLSLLVDILSPSQSIAQGYETYMVELASGRTEAGTLASQSATTITLRQAAKTIPIQRRDIQRLTVVPQSMMPANLDTAITPEQMADLLANLTHP